MSIAGYLIARWVILPLTLFALTMLASAIVTVANLFSPRPAVRALARAAVLRTVVTVLVFFGGVLVAAAVERIVPGGGNVVLVSFAVMLLVWTSYSGWRDSKRIEQEVDELLANMRGGQSVPVAVAASQSSGLPIVRIVALSVLLVAAVGAYFVFRF